MPRRKPRGGGSQGIQPSPAAVGGPQRKEGRAPPSPEGWTPASSKSPKARVKAWTKDTVAHLRAVQLKLDEDDLRLDKALHALGLVRKHTPKDGACMFRAFAEQILGTQALHLKAREGVVRFLRSHPEEFAPFVCTDGMEYEDYCNAMEEWNAWGGEVEIQAFSRANRVDVHIYTPDSSTPLVIANAEGGRAPVQLVYSRGNHYDSVYTIQHMERLEACQNIVYQLVGRATGSRVPLCAYKNIELECWIAAVSKRQSADESIAKSLGSEGREGGWGGFYYKKKREGDRRVRKKTRAELAEIAEQIRKVEEMHRLKAAMKDKEAHFPALRPARQTCASVAPGSGAWAANRMWVSPEKPVGLPVATLQRLLFEDAAGFEEPEAAPAISFGSFT